MQKARKKDASFGIILLAITGYVPCVCVCMNVSTLSQCMRAARRWCWINRHNKSSISHICQLFFSVPCMLHSVKFTECNIACLSWYTTFRILRLFSINFLSVAIFVFFSLRRKALPISHTNTWRICEKVVYSIFHGIFRIGEKIKCANRNSGTSTAVKRILQQLNIQTPTDTYIQRENSLENVSNLNCAPFSFHCAHLFSIHSFFFQSIHICIGVYALAQRFNVIKCVVLLSLSPFLCRQQPPSLHSIHTVVFSQLFLCCGCVLFLLFFAISFNNKSIGNISHWLFYVATHFCLPPRTKHTFTQNTRYFFHKYI